MDITEITPPVDRKFTITLNNSELQVLASALAVAETKEVSKHLVSRNRGSAGADSILMTLYAEIMTFITDSHA